MLKSIVVSFRKIKAEQAHTRIDLLVTLVRMGYQCPFSQAVKDNLPAPLAAPKPVEDIHIIAWNPVYLHCASCLSFF